MMMSLDKFARRIEEMVEAGKEAQQEMTARLAQNPAYAFDYCDKAMEAAAHWDVAALMSNFQSADPSELMRHCLGEALRYARSVSNSTSQVTNLMAQYRAGAYTRLAEALGSNGLSDMMGFVRDLAKSETAQPGEVRLGSYQDEARRLVKKGGL
jgi:hypothetical protein